MSFDFSGPFQKSNDTFKRPLQSISFCLFTHLFYSGHKQHMVHVHIGSDILSDVAKTNQCGKLKIPFLLLGGFCLTRIL